MLDLHDLPAFHSLLNAFAACFLVLGYVFIRFRKAKLHRAAMLAALVCSLAFLTSYLIYHAQVGSVPFRGTGVMRWIYFLVLIPHMILAATVPFLAAVTIRRAFRGELARHKKIARITFPIWLYVSVTGVLVYILLYHLNP